MILYTCAVTGHRPAKLHLGRTDDAAFRLRERIRLQLTELYEKGVRRFLLGGALGVDLWAGEILVSMGKDGCFSGLELVMVLPFAGYDRPWNEQERERMNAVRAHCAQTVIVGNGENPTLCYWLRNRYLVDHADCLLAVYEPAHARSGTGMTVRYGERKGIPIFSILPER